MLPVTITHAWWFHCTCYFPSLRSRRIRSSHREAKALSPFSAKFSETCFLGDLKPRFWGLTSPNLFFSDFCWGHLICFSMVHGGATRLPWSTPLLEPQRRPFRNGCCSNVGSGAVIGRWKWVSGSGSKSF